MSLRCISRLAGLILVGGLAACTLNTNGTAPGAGAGDSTVSSGGTQATGSGGAGAGAGGDGAGAGAGGSASGTGGGTSGAGGGGGGAGGGATTGTGGGGGAGGSGPVQPQFYCGDPNALCAMGEVCCHNGNSPVNDVCGQPGGCGDAVEVQCAGPADCPANMFCCTTFVGGANDIDGVNCRSSCNGANDFIMCTGDPSVCSGGQVCHQGTNVLGPEYDYCGF